MVAKTVDTSKYTRSGRVIVDGKDWEVVLPGAGAELQLSKTRRRMNFLSKKEGAGTLTESDLDLLDALEAESIEFFVNVFKDSTDDNSEVREWIHNTPMSVITKAFEDIQDSAESQNEA